MGDDPFKLSAEDVGKDGFSQGAAGNNSPDAGTAAPRGLGAIKGLLSGNWLLLGLFATGLGFLYAMSLMKGPAPASAQQVQVQSSVDEALAKLTASGAVPGAGKTTAAIVETFYCEAKHRQIPADSIKSNPFVFRAAAVPPPSPASMEPTATTKPAESNGMAEALAAVKALSLRSVMMGGRPAAIISDNLMTEGQSIHGWTVTKILAREVHLTWKDQTYILKMSE